MTSTDARAPFFIMAHHRSGSNFLHDLLQAHPRVECINEPFSMHTRFFRHCDLVHWSAADYDPALLHIALAKHASLRAYLVELRDYLLQSDSGRVVGFKETALFGKLEWLKAYLPSLKILFLTRNPLAIVSSVLRSGLSEFWAYRDLVPKSFREMCPHYVSRALEADAPTRDAEIAAMSVMVRYELARRTVGLFDHKLLPLEDVLRDPESCLQVAAKFLGIQPHPDQSTFLKLRQVASRGGMFSSFRAPDEVQTTWQRHLSAGQIEVVEEVLFAARCDHAGDVFRVSKEHNLA